MSEKGKDRMDEEEGPQKDATKEEEAKGEEEETGSQVFTEDEAEGRNSQEKPRRNANRLLIITTGSRGDVQPFLALGISNPSAHPSSC